MRAIHATLFGLSLIVAPRLTLADEVSFSAQWTLDAKNQNVVEILFKKGDNLVLDPIVASSSPAANEPGYFKITGPKGEDVKFTVVKGQQRDGKIGKIVLVPTQPVAKADEYRVEFVSKNGSDGLLFAPGYSLKSDAASKPIILSKDDLAKNIEFVSHNKAIESKVSVLAGDSGPSISVKLNSGIDKWDNGQIWRLQANADADVTYKPKENNKYINSIVGELDGFYVSPIPKDNFLDVRGVFESGLSSRIETDQDFNLVNWTVGVTEWCALQSPYIAGLARALCIWGKYAGSPNTPIATINYDYVAKLKEDVPSSAPVKQTGNNRLRGRFYWSLKVAQGIPMPIINIDYDASFLVDVGVIYDIEEAKWSPDNRLSLDFSPSSETKKTVPTVTLSYVNGKTTPTFQHFDEFLAGLKIPF
jgi:hypothetical protein